VKVRVSYTVEISDEWRREINRFYGDDGLADRAAVKGWYERYGSSMDEDLANGLEADDPLYEGSDS
jgi:hypothetical protein